MAASRITDLPAPGERVQFNPAAGQRFILTVDTEAQALERARGGRKGKGADAVRACLALIALERVFVDEGPA